MQETQNVQPGTEEHAGPPRNNAATLRWMQELGESCERLAHMMRKPTTERPFVYEVRFDLIPGQSRNPLVVLKGFGESTPLCAFHDASGFLQLLRGLEGRMAAGKLSFYEDKYPPANYQDRVKRYLAGDFYRI